MSSEEFDWATPRDGEAARLGGTLGALGGSAAMLVAYESQPPKQEVRSDDSGIATLGEFVLGPVVLGAFIFTAGSVALRRRAFNRQSNIS